jgi:hypothetical protein
MQFEIQREVIFLLPDLIDGVKKDSFLGFVGPVLFCRTVIYKM